MCEKKLIVMDVDCVSGERQEKNFQFKVRICFWGRKESKLHAISSEDSRIPCVSEFYCLLSKLQVDRPFTVTPENSQ